MWPLAVVGALVALVILIILASRLYFRLTIGRCTCPERMDGKVVIVTGSNCGIGLEAARQLHARGAKVILAVRSLDRGQAAASDICDSNGDNSRIHVMKCDLSQLASVREFVNEFLKTETRLDVLILNAGMVPPPGRFLTSDGYEVQFQSNHLGHFLLVNLLLETLKVSAPSRIISVSSCLHKFGRIDFENLNFEKSTLDPGVVYCMTKLCNVLMINELARRLEGSRVTANSCHPGLVKTNINRRTPWYIRHLVQPVSYFWARNSVEGSQTILHLALAKNVDTISGKYFSDCHESKCSRLANDPQLALELWNTSELMAGITTK